MAVAFNFNMDSVGNQFAEEQPFHVGFDNAACKVDRQGILKADNSAVGPGGKRLAHVNIKAVDKRFHIFRNL